MKKINKKNLTRKIMITIVMILSFNFIAPNYSQADFGGVLMGPVIDLIAGIGDAVMSLLEVFMDGGQTDLLKSDGFSVKSDDFRANGADSYEMGTSKLPSDTQTVEIDSKDLDQGWFGLSTYTIPIIKYGPEKIFANEVPALDANFINPKKGIDTNNNGVIDAGEEYNSNQEEKSIAIQLREVIASWYNALRNLVIVGLLSVLLYVGIRIVLTSTASDKAKYKKMLMDWVIALCLLFFLHYIMAFTMQLIDIVTQGISNATDIKVVIRDSAGDIEFKTNLTGLCRMQVQYNDFGSRIVYLIFYIALVVYTFMFTWQYMKRAITIAFLTLIAPLVVLTYPIDKMGDGKAQAFGMWLKEYIFNALLQPFHLIIYTVFLGSGMQIAVNNPLYAILFLAFITPAEKILRRFFKFDQASTAGATFAGAFGGAAAYNMIKGLVQKGANGGGKQQVGAGNQKGIRQQRQLTDPNAPDGSLAPFTRTRTANTENNNRGNNRNRTTETNNNGNRDNTTTTEDRSTESPRTIDDRSTEPLRTVDDRSTEPPHTTDNRSTEPPHTADNRNTEPPHTTDNRNTEDNKDNNSQNRRGRPRTKNNPNIGEQGEDIGRAEEFRRLTESGMSQEEALTAINETKPFDRNTGSHTSEDDQRGILQWAGDSAKEKWDNSELKQKAVTLKRNVANSKPIRTMASAGNTIRTTAESGITKAGNAIRATKDGIGKVGGKIKSTAEDGIAKAGEIYRKTPKPFRNSVERAGKAGAKVAKAAGEVGVKAVKGAGRVGARTIKGAAGVVKRAAPHAATIAGKTLAAGTMGVIGLGMGIAGDNLEDTLTYGLGGAALGWNVGPAVASNMVRGVATTGTELRNAYEEGAYGRTEAELRQQEREFIANEDNREFFEEKVTEQTGSKPSRQELDQTMKEAAQYNRAGISDVKQINKSMLLEQELQQELQSTTNMPEKEAKTKAREQAITIAKIAQGIDAKDLRDAKKVKELEQSFARELLSKDPSMGEEAAEAQASRIVSMVKKQKKVY